MSENVQIDEAAPVPTFDVLEALDDAVLIDVRTAAEWDQTGVPDISSTGRSLWCVEWISGPQMAPNPAFLDEVLAHAEGVLPGRMFFICKSGARSASAAIAVAALAKHMGVSVHCTNVIEGYQGHPAAGPQSGWKARGLPCKPHGIGRGKT